MGGLLLFCHVLLMIIDQRNVVEHCSKQQPDLVSKLYNVQKLQT